MNVEVGNEKKSGLALKMQAILNRSSKKAHMRLGEVLIKNQVITEEQLQLALGVQNKQVNQIGKPARIGQIIVESGFASEAEIVKVIRTHYRISVTSLADNIKERIEKKRQSLIKKLPQPQIMIWLQLSIATTIIICLVVALLSVGILLRQKKRLKDQMETIGKVSLSYFANDARIPMLDNNILRLNTLINEAESVEGLVYAFIIDNKNQVLAHTDNDKIGTPFGGFPPKENSKEEASGVKSFEYTKLPDKRILNLTSPISFKDKKLGEVHVGVSLKFIEDVIKKERGRIIGMTLFLVLIGIVITVGLGLWFSRPILKLVMATREISMGNYGHKVDLARKDELGNLATAFNKMSDELWVKSLMQDSFGKYVGSEVLEMIMNNPENSWLKGNRSEATIIFTDVRGFTRYTEEKEPEELVEELNECFEIQTAAILDHGGYIDKFIGDAVLGVFGVPVFHKDHIERSVRAAIDMQVALKEASKNSKNRLLASIGIGINSGIVVSGNIGSQVKLEYTVVGDSVNVASRLNGLAGPGEIIISGAIYEQIQKMVAVEALPPQELKGKSEPIQIYKVLGIKERTEGAA
ncbi:adenylate/guanylate cyclase domain-containing protein [Desulfococcaceae bacterium HSG7]|nr:adenylate/guanylate cyclase domain-containing protein [Desulfococcaceae bacterium HSG7]